MDVYEMKFGPEIPETRADTGIQSGNGGGEYHLRKVGSVQIDISYPKSNSICYILIIQWIHHIRIYYKGIYTI